MGDVVERRLDEGVAELRELLTEDVLSEKEVSAVVKKRRVMEHRMTSRAASPQDFLRAVQYELHLQLLVRRRMLALGMKRSLATAIDARRAGRIMQVFDRAVTKFRSNSGLWMAYARHCARNGSARATNKVFARALAICPDCEDLWVNASAWQMDQVADVAAARTIAQRGLRHVPLSIALRLTYFRIELVYLARLRQRRETLKISPTTQPKNSTEEIVHVNDEITHQSQKEESEEDPSAQDDDPSGAFWRGAVPLVVFKDSMSKYSEKTNAYEMALKFLEIARATPHCPEELTKALFDYIGDFFPVEKADTKPVTTSAEQMALQEAPLPQLADNVRNAFEEKVMNERIPRALDQLGSSWVEWEMAEGGPESDKRVQEAVTRVTGSHPLGPRTANSFLIAKLSRQPEELTKEKKSIRKLFETAVGGLDQDVDLWVRYYNFERNTVRNFDRAQAVYWKAKKTLCRRQEFEEECLLR